jgi:uncharacterized protein YbjT (DUF2867 family)
VKSDAMKVLVIGATGQTGAQAVRRLLRKEAMVRVLVRNAEKAEEIFSGAESGGWLEIVQGNLDDSAALQAAFTGSDAAFVALGAVGEQGELQKSIIEAAAAAGLPQLVRLSVLNAGHDSLGINQRAHADLDDLAERSGVGYTTVRPAIYMTNVVTAAREIKATGGWIGIAQHGRNPLIDPRDVADAAAAVILNRSRWGRRYDLTGPELFSWPEATAVLAKELGRPVEYRAVDEATLREELLGRGFQAPLIELLIARERATEARENERLTDTVLELTGARPRTLAQFLHECREKFHKVDVK